MKKYILILATALALGCDEYLNEVKPTDKVPAELPYSSIEGLDAVFTGLYRRIRQYKSGSSHDSRAIGSILNTWNVKGNDFIRPQFHWYIYEYRYQDRENPNGRKPNVVWKMMYELIGTCNTVIANVASSNLSDNVKLWYTAEARAIRGWAYHHLLMDYAPAYSLGTAAVGVPIYLEATTEASATEGKSRASVGEGYAQVLEDLNFAATNLTKKRKAKWALDKNVVYGLLARAYLHMGNYEKAAEWAKKAREGYMLKAEEYGNGFQDIEDEEWMWGAPQNNNQTVYYASFASIWGKGRYPRVMANPSFVAHFSATDVRNLFTIDSAATKTYLKDKKDLYLYTTSKFTTDPNFGEDLVLMRVAEMYLIEAEALARSGNEATAAALLFELQSNRDSNATASNNTGESLIAEIMLERRKELYAERGVDFIDARRLGIGLTRDDNHPESYRFILEPEDPRYLLKIPQDELDNNDEINPNDQNE